MTRGQRGKLLAEQTRLLPQLDALLRRAAGWIDPPGSAPAAAPEAGVDSRRARRDGARRSAAESTEATPRRAATTAPAALPPTHVAASRSAAFHAAPVGTDSVAASPSTTPAPVLRLRLPVRRATPVIGRVAKVAAPIAPVAVSAPPLTPPPPRATNAAPTRSSITSDLGAQATATTMTNATPVTRRATPPSHTDSTGGAWSAQEHLAAWPSRGAPDQAEASRTTFPRAESADPFADAALEDRMEAILDRALAETGLDPA